MQILNSTTVVVTTSSELKTALSEDNGYVYIYLGNDITLEGGFTINENKSNVVIDGTYLNTKHTYTNTLSELTDVIMASPTNKKIIVKNIEIESSHSLGVISTQASNLYSNVSVEYSKVNFSGIELSYNPYGKTIILDSIIEIRKVNGVEPQRLCDSCNIEIGGKSLLISNETTNPLFRFIANLNCTLTFLSYSNINITTSEEIMINSNKLELKVLHDADVTLITGNGFAPITTNGVSNVLIDERAKFTFIEKSHQRIPMWSIYGDFIVNEGASVEILNTYMNTPSDNYNIHFKGTNQKLILNNPKSVNIYTKNANVLYTNNPLEFSFKFSRINMWIDAEDFTTACTINDLPTLAWYKDKYLATINGTITNNTTTITSHNFTSDELSNLPDISNFSFQSKKILSIGSFKVNIHPITSSSSNISGHTMELANVKIEYGNISTIVEVDSDGLFEYSLPSTIPDNTEIKLTTCLSGIYVTRKITTPFEGELTLLKVSGNITFDNSLLSGSSVTLPKKSSNTVTIVDSRLNSKPWKLYINFVNPMKTESGLILIDALIFNKFNNENVILKSTPILVYSGSDNGGNIEVSNITFSTEKGLLLKLADTSILNFKEEYSTKVIWTLES